MRITIKHVLYISLLLLIIETVFFASFNYFFIRDSSLRLTSDSVYRLLHARLAMVYEARQNDKSFNENFTRISQELMENNISMNLSVKPIAKALTYPENRELLSSKMIATLEKTLLKDKTVSLATYLPQRDQWLILTARYSMPHSWQYSFVLLLTNLTLLLVIWLGFVLYYRYTLPKRVINTIIGGPKANGSDELVMALKKQIQHYYEEKSLMITALAHDIKTPLTEALLRLELLLNDENITSADRETLSSIQVSLNEINNIVRSSLEYAKEPDQIRKRQVDVISLLESLVESEHERGFMIDYKSDVTSCEMKIELQLFKRMINNLIENAKKYAASMRIIVTQPDRKHLAIEFEDDGPGVPEQFLQLLSVPYFRVDQSRSKETGGYGLGLAIVKKIVEIHDGDIIFDNLAGGGFRVKIVFKT